MMKLQAQRAAAQRVAPAGRLVASRPLSLLGKPSGARSVPLAPMVAALDAPMTSDGFARNAVRNRRARARGRW
jgi:hypothetical protein